MTEHSATAANKQLVIDYFRDVVAAFDVRPLARFVADDFVLHGADDLVGIDAFEQILLRDFEGHPPLDASEVRMIPPAFIVAEDDLVTIAFFMPMAEPDGSGAYDYYGLNTYRIADGRIAERWTNEHRYARPQFLPEMAAGKAPTGPEHVGSSDLAANKQLVVDFYAKVFAPLDAGAVADFVAEDYFQHVAHMPQGRVGLEAFVAGLAAAAPPLPEGVTAPPMPAPDVLHAEGDMVVIAARIPQPLRDGEAAGTWNYYAYDVYRVRDGLLAEHWSGIDKHARPEHG